MDSASLLAAFRERHELLRMLADTLDRKTRDALAGIAHVDRISFRAKDPHSFVEKALDPEKSYSDPLSEIEDQVGGRVITFFHDDIQRVRSQLSSFFGAVEYAPHEPARDAEFGYESDHYILVINENWKPAGWDAIESMPTTFELQIRTLFQHAWAEPQHDLGYKNRSRQELTRDDRRELAWIAASAWGADRSLNRVARRLISNESEPGPDRGR